MATAEQTFGVHSAQGSPQQSPAAANRYLQEFLKGVDQPRWWSWSDGWQTATQAAADAAAAAAQSQGGSVEKKELYLLIPKPSTFAPENSEQEISLWRDWCWSLRQYLLVVDGKFETDLTTLSVLIMKQLIGIFSMKTNSIEEGSCIVCYLPSCKGDF